MLTIDAFEALSSGSIPGGPCRSMACCSLDWIISLTQGFSLDVSGLSSLWSFFRIRTRSIRKPVFSVDLVEECKTEEMGGLGPRSGPVGFVFSKGR